MPEPSPLCIGCTEILTIEEKDFIKSQPGFTMGERVAVVECPECGKKQRQEMFKEISWQGFELEDNDQSPAAEAAEASEDR